MINFMRKFSFVFLAVALSCGQLSAQVGDIYFSFSDGWATVSNPSESFTPDESGSVFFYYSGVIKERAAMQRRLMKLDETTFKKE